MFNPNPYSIFANFSPIYDLKSPLKELISVTISSLLRSIASMVSSCFSSILFLVPIMMNEFLLLGFRPTRVLFPLWIREDSGLSQISSKKSSFFISSHPLNFCFFPITILLASPILQLFFRENPRNLVSIISCT